MAEDAPEVFARDDLAARLDTTYRVYLEVVHRPRGVLRTPPCRRARRPAGRRSTALPAERTPLDD
jgi:hypothetical protein